MKKTIIMLGLIATCVLSSYSQQSETRSSVKGHSDGSVSAGKVGHTHIQSDTRLEAELQNSLDARKAKIGDQVVLKTTHAIKKDGRTLIDKGARLVGRVTEVERETKASSASRIGIVIERMEKGSLEFPISAEITSVTRRSGNTRASNDELFTSGRAQSSTSARSSTNAQARGGLLSGVANTAGGAVNATTVVAGQVAEGATTAVGTTTDSTTSTVIGGPSGPGRSIKRIEISESSNSSIAGAAVLSLRGENLRLEKGTRFNLVINQSARAGAARQE